MKDSPNIEILPGTQLNYGINHFEFLESKHPVANHNDLNRYQALLIELMLLIALSRNESQSHKNLNL